jgi:hypothetical protein
MKTHGVRLLGSTLLPLVLGGCEMLGAGGSVIGSLLQVVMYIAIIAAPIILGYYIYRWTR